MAITVEELKYVLTAEDRASTAIVNASAAMTKAADAAEVLDERQTRASKSGVALANAMDPLTKAVNNLERAQRQQRDGQAALNADLAAGRISAEQAAGASTVLTERVVKASQVLGAARGVAQDHAETTAHLAQTTGVAAYQMKALAQQMPDVVSGILTGQSAFQVLIQQGGQVVQVAGGMGNAFKVVGAGLSSVVSILGGPWGVAMLAATAVTAGFIAHGMEMEAQQRAIAIALRGVGRDAEIAAGQLAGYQRQLEKQGVARADAAGIVTSLARVPGLSGAAIGQVAGMAPDAAVALGTDAAGAAKAIGDAAAGSYSAIVKLDDSLNLLTADQRIQIRTMLEHGDRVAAVSVVMGELGKRVSGLRADSLTPMGGALEQLSGGWKTFIDAVSASKPVLMIIEGAGLAIRDMAKAINNPGAARNEGESLADQIAEITMQIEKLQGGTYPAASMGTISRRVQGLVDQRDALINRRAVVTTSAIPGGAGDVAPPGGLGELSPGEVETRRQASLVGDLTKSLTDQQRILAASVPDRVRVRAEIAAENEIRDKGLTGLAAENLMRSRIAEALGTETDARAQETAAISRAGAAALALVTATEKGRAATLIAAAAAEAHEKAVTQTGVAEGALTREIINRNAAQEAAKGAETVLNMKDQVTATTALVAAEKQGNRAAAYAAVEEKIRAATVSLRAQRDATTDPAIKAALDAQIGQIGRLTTEQEKLNQQAQLYRQINQQNNDIEYLTRESELLGTNEAYRTRELAILRVKQQLQASGQLLSQDEQNLLIANTGRLVDMQTALQQQKSSMDALTQGMTQAFDQVGSAITNAFVGGQGAAVNWGNVARGAVTSVLQQVAKLAVINPAMNYITGGSSPTLSAALGNGGGSSGGFSLSNLNFNSLSNLDIGSLFTSPFASAGSSTSSALAGMGQGVYGPATAEAFSAAGGAGTSLGGYFGGLGMGFGAGSMLGNLINPQHSLGSTVGAGLGAAVGSIFGPAGGLIGGLLGGAAGSLFGPGKAHHGWSWQIQGNGEDGIGLGNRVFVDPIAQQQFQQEQQQMAQFNQYLKANGIGASGIFEVGANNNNPNQVSSFAAGIGQLQFSSRTNPTLNTALGSGKVNGLDDLETLVTFVTQTFKSLSDTAPKIGAVQTQIDALNKTYDDAIAKAREYGLAEEGLVTNRDRAIAEIRAASVLALGNTETGLRARLLAANGDSAGASLLTFDARATQERVDLEKQLKDAYGDAYTATTDYARITGELNDALAAERGLVVNQQRSAAAGAVAGVVTNLSGYAQGLAYSDLSALSPQAKLSLASSQFNAVSGAALAGDYRSLAGLQNYANSYLTASRDVNGSGAAYAASFAQVMDVLGRVADINPDALTSSAFLDGTKQQTVTLVDELRRLGSALASISLELRQNGFSQAAAA